MNKKRIKNIVMVAVTIILFASIISYLFVTRKSEPTVQNQKIKQSQVPTQYDEIARWKVYKEPQLKYEFRYPPVVPESKAVFHKILSTFKFLN